MLRIAPGDDHFQVHARLGDRLELGVQPAHAVLDLARPHFHLAHGVRHESTSAAMRRCKGTGCDRADYRTLCEAGKEDVSAKCKCKHWCGAGLMLAHRPSVLRATAQGPCASA